MKLKFGDSIYKKDLSNSIYQQKGAGFGLSMSGGMEINNRPDGMTGIAQLAMAKKAQHRAEKVSRIAEGTMLGNIRSEMVEGPEMD
jgi:hypothetical protein